MYSSGYTPAKFPPGAREPLHRPRGKSCGYYLRIIFFFSSLIQSLIIVSLVLFLIYGQPEKSAEEKRNKELELTVNRLSENSMQLRKEKAALETQLGARKTENEALGKELAKLKTDANNTERALKEKLDNCAKMTATTLSVMARRPTPPIQPPVVFNSNNELKNLQTLSDQQKAMITLIEANFTQTVQYLNQEREINIRERDKHHQEAIVLRRDNAMLREQLITYTKKCKEDFAHSLAGIQAVTRDFLNKINSVFPHQMTFYINCESHREQMEKIRNSCTNLSRDVENKFQLYLDKVGDKVADIQAKSSEMEVKNSYLNSDLQKCERIRTEAAAESTKQLQLNQKTHDDQVEKLLIEQNRLREQKKLQEDNLALKEKELQLLRQMTPAQSKPGVTRSVGLQTGSQPKWPSHGAPVISKTPTVR